MSKRFDIGKLVATAGVHEVMANNPLFKEFVNRSLERYFVCDWGDSCEDSVQQNNKAVDGEDEKIFAVYEMTGHPDNTIWIITDPDRSTTTIQFPHKY